MNRYHALLLILTTAFLFGSDDPKDDGAKKEREKLAGTWKVTSAERDGRPDKVSQNAMTTYTADGKFKVKFADDTTGAGTYKLDPTKEPKAIDYTMNYGPNKDKPHEGIYALEGDTLKICRSDPGKPRPTEFATKADSGQMLFVLTRQKTQTAKVPPATPPAVLTMTASSPGAIVRLIREGGGEG